MSENKEEAKTLNLVQKLAKIQLELKAPKNQRNKFGNYNYRSAEDILEAVKPLAIKYGCVVNVSDDVVFVPCETKHIAKNADGEFIDEYAGRIYVKATVTLMDCDSDKTISVTASAREEENKKGMDGSQVTGASSSYARKYALNGMFAIDDTKDSDATNDHGKGQPQQTAGQILNQAKAKSAPNPKFKKAWSDYCANPNNEGVDKAVLSANFRKLCVETTGNDKPESYGDAEWDKVLTFIAQFK